MQSPNEKYVTKPFSFLSSAGMPSLGSCHFLAEEPAISVAKHSSTEQNITRCAD